MKRLICAAAALAMVSMFALGCGEPTATEPDSPPPTGHSHVHGPELGGEMFKFDSDYQAEMKGAKGANVVRIVILDEAGKAAAPVAAEKLIVRRTTGTDGEEFTLMPDPDSEKTEDGKTAVFSLDSQELTIAMNLGLEIEMTIGDKTYTGKLAPYEPH